MANTHFISFTMPVYIPKGILNFMKQVEKGYGTPPDSCPTPKKGGRNRSRCVIFCVWYNFSAWYNFWATVLAKTLFLPPFSNKHYVRVLFIPIRKSVGLLRNVKFHIPLGIYTGMLCCIVKQVYFTGSCMCMCVLKKKKRKFEWCRYFFCKSSVEVPMK